MKLIRELSENIEYITESEGKKNLYISGIFMQSEVKNRNGRIYPEGVMSNEVNRYIAESVTKNRALGELGHPPGPQINLDKVSHIIESLKFDRTNITGKAKILDTPAGNIARGLIEGGANIGVSSRGLGSLKEGKNGIMEVQPDFRLVTIDIVADPSAPEAFVQGILEGSEWYFNDQTGEWAKQIQKEIKETPIKRLDEAAMLRFFEKYIKTL